MSDGQQETHGVRNPPYFYKGNGKSGNDRQRIVPVQIHGYTHRGTLFSALCVVSERGESGSHLRVGAGGGRGRRCGARGRKHRGCPVRAEPASRREGGVSEGEYGGKNGSHLHSDGLDRHARSLIGDGGGGGPDQAGKHRLDPTTAGRPPRCPERVP